MPGLVERGIGVETSRKGLKGALSCAELSKGNLEDKSEPAL